MYYVVLDGTFYLDIPLIYISKKYEQRTLSLSLILCNVNFEEGLIDLSLSHHYPGEGEPYLYDYFSPLIVVYIANG